MTLPIILTIREGCRAETRFGAKQNWMRPQLPHSNTCTTSKNNVKQLSEAQTQTVLRWITVEVFGNKWIFQPVWTRTREHCTSSFHKVYPNNNLNVCAELMVCSTKGADCKWRQIGDGCVNLTGLWNEPTVTAASCTRRKSKFDWSSTEGEANPVWKTLSGLQMVKAITQQIPVGFDQIQLLNQNRFSQFLFGEKSDRYT